MTREEYWKSLSDDYKQALKLVLDYPFTTKKDFDAFCKTWAKKPATVYNDLTECKTHAQ